MTSWITTKPSSLQKSATWSSAQARSYRSRLSKKEKELKNSLEEMGFADLYDRLMTSTRTDELSKTIKKVIGFKSSIKSSVEKGYISNERPTNNRRAIESIELFDEKLYKRVTDAIGSVRSHAAQKLKFEFEQKDKFRKEILAQQPGLFLHCLDQSAKITIDKYYNDINLSKHELKEKDSKRNTKRNTKLCVPNDPREHKTLRSNTNHEPPRSQQEKKPKVSELMREAEEDSSSEFEDDSAKLTLRAIRCRKNKVLKQYKKYKEELKKNSHAPYSDAYFDAMINYKQCKSDYKRYTTLERDYGKEDKMDQEMRELIRDSYSGEIDINELAMKNIQVEVNVRKVPRFIKDEAD